VSALAPTQTARVELLGCRIDALDMDGTLERCQSFIEERSGAHQISVNAAKLVALRSDPRLREIVSASPLVNADGQSVVWAARLLGRPLPGRVAGIDLMNRLLELAERSGYRVYFLGAHADVLARALEQLQALHPNLVVAGARDGYFSDDESKAVAAGIRDADPDLLFVAMSSPRKEYWVAEQAEDLGVPFVMGVGGALDVVAGTTRRAPRWAQRIGMEWFVRLLQEPRRLFGRYARTNSRFVWLVARELVRKGHA
jgi:N-acetylglucosaminyldiphosphoundecaprenol N-acetyl-beta-D-mannosaminyltransferase